MKNANTYDVIRDFGLEPGADHVELSPYWIVCVFRLKYPTTYDRSKKQSLSEIYSDAVAIRGKPMVITDDCLSLSVSGSKANYLMQLNATLIGEKTDYLSEIFPGDYIMAWMVNSRESYGDLIKRLNELGDSDSPLNQFNDGLKFFGRVQSLRKKLTQLPEGGRTIRYSLNGTSFNELDAQVFYEEHLAEKIGAIGKYLGRLGKSLNDLIAEKGQGLDINKAIPLFLDLMLGEGVPASLGRGNPDPRIRSTTGMTPGYAYVLPDIVGKTIGKNKTGSSGGLITYADCLETVIGIQSYSSFSLTGDESALVTSEISNVNMGTFSVAQNFQPTGTHSGGSRRVTDPLLGVFTPQIPHFTDKSVWTVLRQYLNPAVNEMYTALRVNPEGLVVPTLVVRQLPFTSEFLQTDLKVTRYLSLPRWGIDGVLVRNVDIGRSDALRMNFVHVYGDTIDRSQPFAAQIVRNPPIRDDLDIARSGLRPHMETVACSPGDVRSGGPAKWMEITSDIMIGQHLTLTGVMTTVGIQSPICPGDNMEWDGTVYHIESVTHSCGISADGRKNFSTTLALTHGINANPGLGEMGIYGAVDSNDHGVFDPGLTVDSKQKIDTNQRPGTTQNDDIGRKGSV